MHGWGAGQRGTFKSETGSRDTVKAKSVTLTWSRFISVRQNVGACVRSAALASKWQTERLRLSHKPPPPPPANTHRRKEFCTLTFLLVLGSASHSSENGITF